MNRKELKTATDSEVIINYIKSYANYASNACLGRGTEKLSSHLADLDTEMLNRGILTAEQIALLNM